MTAATYRAMQIARPGVLEATERPLPVPGTGEVVIAVEACGVCGADVGDIDRAAASATPPRVPGHEAVGRIVAVGDQVPPLFALGRRVGVGRLGGPCGVCRGCRQGRFELCTDQPVVGVTVDGGYAERMLSRASGLVAIPDALSAEEAAPILCAGLATFNALRKCGAEAGDTVAILGVGGLGHLAVQYARNMGFRVVALTRGDAPEPEAAANPTAGSAATRSRADAARAFGAHQVLDARSDADAAQLLAAGGAQAVVATIGHAPTLQRWLGALAPGGRLVVLGGGNDPLAVRLGPMIAGERSVLGSITGSPHDSERALSFSVLTGARPQIERMPLAQAQQAYERVKSGQARFRVVLTM